MVKNVTQTTKQKNMVQSYIEDSSVSETGALGRFGELLSGFGKGGYAIMASLAGAASLVALNPLAWVVSAPLYVANVFGANIPTAGESLATGAGFAGSGFIGAFGLMAAAGGVLKGIQEMRDGRPKKGIKEMIKGVAEGLFVGMAATFALAKIAGVGGILLLSAELISKMATGKTITSHFGDAVGSVLDTVMGTKETPKMQRGAVNVAQMQGLAMQQQMGMAPTMMMPQPAYQPVYQPAYGGMMAPGGMAYSAVPAAVGAPQMMQQQPTYWQNRVAPDRMMQQQAPVTLPPTMAGRYADAVDIAREAAEHNPELTNR
jgi:hypothetical protein